jgi:hypothetical protein
MDQGQRYDRQKLLYGEKRNTVLELEEVQRYGTDSFNDPDYVSLYAMSPADWYAKGVRLLGRTAVECTRDQLSDMIGKDVAGVVAQLSNTTATLVVDPFVGSGNTLYWLLRHLLGARGLGFEMDARVFRLTKENISLLALPIEILNTDYRSGLESISVPADQLLVTFIAPPWGDALSVHGLDLRRTIPPIREVVDFLIDTFPGNCLLCAIQVYETVDPTSLAELKVRLDWSELRLYDLNTPGANHGVLLGGKRWSH